MKTFSAVFKAFSRDKKSSAKSNNKVINPRDLALKNALDKCKKEIKKSRRWGRLPSSKYFEHAAMLSRQAKNYDNEIKICQAYISLLNENISKRTFNIDKNIERAEVLSQTLAKRLETAKRLRNKTGVNVEYL
ncbi:MAG: hypothetical protein AAGB35_09900 [Pseudomonadota bacterium]